MKTIKKNSILTSLLSAPLLAACMLSLIPSNPANAQTGGGVYGIVGRSNDIFLFCKYGVPTDGWISINPSIGQYQIITQYPNLQWIPAFVTLCPAGGPKPGTWKGPGDGSLTPFYH